MHLGIDLGGTKTEIIALNGRSDTLYRKRVPSPKGSYQNTLANLCQLVHEAEEHLGHTGTLGVGIPGALSPETGRIKNANSTWLIGHDLKTDLSQRLKRPVLIANDADCFTLSEASDGAAADHSVVFGVILGTGVGGGICIDHNLLSGPNAIAGEWGHNPLPWSKASDLPAPCYCGKTGCIETFLSGPGFKRQYADALPSLRTIDMTDDVTSEMIIDKAGTGDPAALSLLETYQNQLARALASVINILDPGCIVLGGGMSNITAIYSGLHDAIGHYVFSDTLNTTIARAKHGDASGVRGAAWLGSRNHV